MAKFIFKFNTLKKYKENLEKILQKEIAEIDLEIAAKQENIKQIVDELYNAKENLLKKQKLSGFDLNYYQDFSNFCEHKINKLQDEIKTLEKKRQNKVAELLEKTKEKKIVYRIEELHKEAFEFGQNKIEQSFIDELASVRFAREQSEK